MVLCFCHQTTWHQYIKFISILTREARWDGCMLHRHLEREPCADVLENLTKLTRNVTCPLPGGQTVKFLGVGIEKDAKHSTFAWGLPILRVVQRFFFCEH